MYQRAGITADSPCNTPGILSIGNIMPESSVVGIISTIPEASIAATCVLTSVEISNPSASAVMTNSSEITDSQNRLPATGTCRM